MPNIGRYKKVIIISIVPIGFLIASYYVYFLSLQYIHLGHYLLPFVLNPIAFVYMDRKELSPILSEYPLENIYNFDASGLLYRLLAMSGNFLGATKGRRSTKLAKDMITEKIFCNATWAYIWKPCSIGAAKNLCHSGNHWTPEKAGAIYYNIESAWMKAVIWLDINHKFNKYCYDKRHVVMLAGNYPAHKPTLGATPWQQGHLQGYKMSNVQPLDAGNCS